jgi:predicted metalloprotease
MRWRTEQGSNKVENQRGASRIPGGAAGGLGGIGLIIILGAAVVVGVDPGE